MTSPTGVRHGTVKWYDRNKGIGFIFPDGTDPDDRSTNVFIHHTELRRAGLQVLNPGDRVEFETKRTDRSFAAKNIKMVGPCCVAASDYIDTRSLRQNDWRESSVTGSPPSASSTSA